MHIPECNIYLFSTKSRAHNDVVDKQDPEQHDDNARTTPLFPLASPGFGTVKFLSLGFL